MQKQRFRTLKSADRRDVRKALFSEITISARTMPVKSMLYALQFSKKMLANDMRAIGKADSEKSLRHQRRLSKALAALRSESVEFDEQKRNRVLLLAVRHYVNMFYRLGPKQRSTYTVMVNKVFTRIKAENNLLVIPAEMAASGVDRKKAVDRIYGGILEMPVRLLYDSCRAALDVELLQSRMGIKHVPDGPVNTIKESLGILYDNMLSEYAIPQKAGTSAIAEDFVNDVIEASDEAGMVVPYFIAHRFAAESVMEESMRKMARKALSFELRS